MSQFYLTSISKKRLDLTTNCNSFEKSVTIKSNGSKVRKLALPLGLVDVGDVGAVT